VELSSPNVGRSFIAPEPLLTILVTGDPAPKGSKKAFVVKGRAIITDVSHKGSRDRLGAWELAVTAAVQRALERKIGWSPLDEPLLVVVTFWLARPAGAPKRVVAPAKKPDLDKLARALLDVCTKTVWVDDARIVELRLEKRFAQRTPGARIEVARAGETY